MKDIHELNSYCILAATLNISVDFRIYDNLTFGCIRLRGKAAQQVSRVETQN